MLGLETRALGVTEIGVMGSESVLAISRTPGDSGLAELTRMGVLCVSDVLGVYWTSHEPLGVPESQILDVEGAGIDSGAPRRLLTVPATLGRSERVTGESVRPESQGETGVPIPALGRALAESVRALVGSTRTETRTERGGLGAALGDGARRGGRVRKEWRAVGEPPKLRMLGIEGVSADVLRGST